MWPYITGAVTTSPRTTFLISSTSSGGIVSGDMKLIFGVQKAGRNKQPPLATNNLLEVTDGLRRPPRPLLRGATQSISDLSMR